MISDPPHYTHIRIPHTKKTLKSGGSLNLQIQMVSVQSSDSISHFSTFFANQRVYYQYQRAKREIHTQIFGCDLMFFRRVKTKLFRDLAVQISSFTSTKHLSCTVPNSQIVSTFLIIIITFSSTCDLIYIIFPRFNLVLYSLRTKESIPHKTPNYLGDPPTGYVSPQKKI